MRPRGRGDDLDDDEDYESSPQRSAQGPDAEAEPAPAPAPQPTRAPLSSLVVRPSPPPSPQGNGASSPSLSPARSSPSPSPARDAQGRRRGSSLPRRRRDLSPPDPRFRERRRSPPPPARRRPGSPPPQRRRFSPPGFQPRQPRFYDEPQGSSRSVHTVDLALLRMEDKRVDTMEIDGQQQQGVDAAVPDGFNTEYLRVYYAKLFPYGDFFKWLCYGNDAKHPGCDQSYIGRRELSFTLENDIYLRFQSFDSAAELESSIKEKCPFKIDIGPVYSVDPAKRHAYAQSGNNVFVPVERELIFDIDISDYDDVRYCCSGADTCMDCWPLMTIVIKILDASLRGDFGFNHILWVYSGRRGVHCWVCDSRARKLTNEQRSAIADYFRVYKGNENALKKVSLIGPVLHPFLARSYTDVLKCFFEDKLLHSQQLLASEERCQKIFELIPDENVASELHDRWQGNRRSSISKEDVNAARWEQLKTALQSGKHKTQGLRRCVEEIVFSYTYPRLDMEVSKHMNHLLKAPFCIHPKTGRVCVPIDPNDCDDFDPSAVPTLSQLLGELNAAGMQMDSESDWERTSLEKSIRFFRTSFLQPMLKACKEELESAYNTKLQQSKNSINW